MLSISIPLSDPEYVLSMARLSYYTEGGEPLGQWFGSGSLALGLSGTVEAKILRTVFKGLSPDGQRELVQNVGSRDRQAGWDLTFSAGKTVSILWAISAPPLRSAVEKAHDEAVKVALAWLEREAGLTRRGKGSRIVEPAKLIFAIFQHGSSRARDPQLHSHCLLLNLCVREDGTTGSIVTKEIFRLKMIAGLVYRQALGHSLRHHLGFGLRQVNRWFEVEGVPTPLIETFSKRRQEVLAYLEKMERSDAVAAAAAAKATRKGKELVPRKELFEEWAQFARDEHGFTRETAESLRSRPHPSKSPVGLAAAIDTLLEQQSYFSDRDFLRRVLELNQATGHSVDRILRAVRLALRNLVDLGIHEGRHLYTTPDVIRAERILLEEAMEGAASRDHLVSERRALAAAKGLAPSQRQALIHITSTPGNIKVIQGLAGTGKSSLLSAAREAWEAAGHRVIGGAYSGKAADGLQHSSGIPSHTVDRLLNQWSKDLSAVKPLNRESILVVDEAGMLDTFKMRKLIDVVRRTGAKLVLVGDEKQLPPISAGAPFPELGRRLGRGELTEIHRQKNGLLKLVVEELADGDVKRALSLLRHDRLIRLHPHREDARHALVSDWFAERQHSESIMLAGTREDVRDLNLRAQAIRAKYAQVKLPMLSLNGISFRLCDRVLFGRNDQRLGVRNGTLGELTGFNPLTRTATVRLDSGKRVFIPIDTYKKLDLGYCLTTHTNPFIIYRTFFRIMRQIEHEPT